MIFSKPVWNAIEEEAEEDEDVKQKRKGKKK